MSTGFVYKLINSVDEMVYIGSTRRSIAARFNNHKAGAKNVSTRTSRLYQHMRKIGAKYFDVVLVAEVKGKKDNVLEQAEFREMEKYPPKLLLNMNREYGKRCAEHNAKVGRRGQTSPHFNRGSIFRIQKLDSKGYLTDAVIFRWLTHDEQGKSRQHQKNFSVKKHGLALAQRLAEEARDLVFPKGK
jgi:predicted GIY-YIG superfamily endonuclease